MAQSSNEEASRVNLRIKFRSETLENFVERYGSDVSPGGVFIRSKTPLEIGTKVSFSLSLMTGNPVLVGEGTVVWARKPEADKPGGNPGMGIRFDQLTDESRVMLTRVLEAKGAQVPTGRPPVRGPTPIPEPPPGAGFGISEPTARMRLTNDGRIVKDMPVPGPPVVGGQSLPPSQPYAASFSQPGPAQFSQPTPAQFTQPGPAQFTQPTPAQFPQPTPAQFTQPGPAQFLHPTPAHLDTSHSEATRVGPAPEERMRRATPALGGEDAQPFGFSRTLANAAAPLPGSGGVVVRAPKPAPQPGTGRSFTPAFSSPTTGLPTPSFATDPATRAAGGSAFSSTAIFGSEPTRMQGQAATVAPPRVGNTPTPAIVRPGTLPSMPVARPSSVFSRPTPVPVGMNTEPRSTRSGPVVNRPSQSMPAVTAPPKAATGWGDDQTEIVEDLPSFDEEKTTTVKGQVLAHEEPAHHVASAHVEFSPYLAARPPERDELSGHHASASMPALDHLFEGEGLPTQEAASSSLLSTLGAEEEFGRADSTGRGRRPTPVGFGTSMVARKVGYQEEHRRGRPILWVLLGMAAVGGAVFGFVQYTSAPPDAVMNKGQATSLGAEPGPGLPPGKTVPVAAPAAPEVAATTPGTQDMPAGEAAPEATRPAGAEAGGPAAAAEAARPAAPTPGTTRPAAAAAEAARPEPAAPVAARPAPAAPIAARPAPADEKLAPRAVAAAEEKLPPAAAARTPRPAATPKPKAEAAAAAAPEVDDVPAIYWLRIKSIPANAEVFIDGKSEGTTPFQRRIFDATRPYALSIRKEGYEEHERMVSASDPWVKGKGEAILTVTVKLRKLPGGEAPASAASPSPATPASPAPESPPPASPTPASPAPAEPKNDPTIIDP